MQFHRAPGLIGGMADIFQQAVDTFGIARDAKFASVPNDLVSKQNPFLARDNAHQILLDLLRIIVGGQFEAARDAMHVSVDDHTVRDLEP